MPYQLPPELRTSKLDSLPDDLREIAEAALAAKFDIPEITVAKKKPAPKKESETSIGMPPTDYPYHGSTVQVRIDFVDEYPMSASTNRNMYAWVQMYPRQIGPSNIIRDIEMRIRSQYQEMQYRTGMGNKLAVHIEVDGRRDKIENFRDIERLVLMAFNDERARGWRGDMKF